MLGSFVLLRGISTIDTQQPDFKVVQGIFKSVLTMSYFAFREKKKYVCVGLGCDKSRPEAK